MEDVRVVRVCIFIGDDRIKLFRTHLIFPREIIPLIFYTYLFIPCINFLNFLYSRTIISHCISEESATVKKNVIRFYLSCFVNFLYNFSGNWEQRTGGGEYIAYANDFRHFGKMTNTLKNQSLRHLKTSCFLLNCN